MNKRPAHWDKSREIVKRIVIEGQLTLETPTSLGNGETFGPTDMNLLRDPVDPRRALLTGTSIAGALRNYLREVRHGYGEPSPEESPVLALFGESRGADAGNQSLLIVDDAPSEAPAAVEIRDGVRIEAATGTAAEGAKFDIELLQAGTTFPLRFELLIPQDQDEAALKEALAQALYGFEQGAIPLGARKRRGFGRCRVGGWRVTRYDLTTPAGIVAWLKEEGTPSEKDTIATALGVALRKEDARQRFELDATFSLDGSLLIRAEAESGADAGHLRSPRPGEKDPVPVLPGTSLAGVLRHRALRIANTLATGGQGIKLVEEIFGRSPTEDDKSLTASRVAVQETEVKGVRPLVQTRVKIDRFTGGAYPTALFSEEPVFGGPESRVQVKLTLRNPEDHEVGLLLLLLKDLWTGDLPVGGESSVGRGRLRGIKAHLQWDDDTWHLVETPDGLQMAEGDHETLEQCVGALRAHLTKEVDDETAA